MKATTAVSLTRGMVSAVVMTRRVCHASLSGSQSPVQRDNLVALGRTNVSRL